jgi:hypothetical protein
VIEPGTLGPETPAVVDLVVHGGEPSGNALAATVVDLAARGFVRLEEPSPDRYLCRLPRLDDESALTPYEAQVLALLRTRAHDDVVPVEALTVGVEDEASEWWGRFRSHVVAHARADGLTRVAKLLPAVIAVVVLAAFAVAFWWWNDSWLGIVVFGVALAGAIALSMTPDDWLAPDRLSPRGRAVRAHWERHRDELGANDGFADLPPTSVVIWGRYLAFAAALDLAPAACRPLPLGPDSTRVAWVRRDDRWRRVPVRLPRSVLPGSGRSARVSLLLGCVTIAAAGVVLVGAAERGRWHPSPPFADDVADMIGELEPLVVALAFVVLALGAWELVLAVGALVGAPRLVEGTIAARCARQGWRPNPWRGLMPTRHFVVVDDGVSDPLRGWCVSRAELSELERGDAVTAWVDPTIRRVRAIVRPAGGVPAVTPGPRVRRGRARGGRDGGPLS